MVTWRRMALPSNAGVPLSKTSKFIAAGRPGVAVLVLFEQADDFGAALFVPGFGVRDLLAVRQDEQVGQRVVADLRLVVVHRDAGDHSGWAILAKATAASRRDDARTNMPIIIHPVTTQALFCCRGFGDQPRPSGLMAGADARAVIAVEVFVEQDEVAPVRVDLEYAQSPP